MCLRSIIEQTTVWVLNKFQPEMAHDLAVIALKTKIGLRAKTDPDALGATLFKGHTGEIELSNPVGLAAGWDKAGAVIQALGQIVGFGFVEAGTITILSRKGNPKKRIWRIGKDGIINRMGFNGIGLNSVLKNFQKFRAASGDKPIAGANISFADVNTQTATHQSYVLAQAMKDVADYITLNVSCPNVEHGESNDEEGKIKDIARQVEAAVTGAGDTPVTVKFAPSNNIELLLKTARAAIDVGAAGIITMNTVGYDQRGIINGSNDLDWPAPLPSNQNIVGGYSGAKALPIMIDMIKALRAEFPDTTIIAVGGIQSAENAREALSAGADAIQILTGFVRQGIPLINEIKENLAADISWKR